MNARFAIFLALLLILGAHSAQASRDITISVFSPSGNTRVALNLPTPVLVTIKNNGSEIADTIGVRVTMLDLSGSFYDDSVTVYALAPNSSIQVALEDMVRTKSGPFEETITLTLKDDEQIGDNSLSIDNQASSYEHDVIAFAVIDPADGGGKPQKLGFRPVGSFMSFWSPEYSTAARVQIRRCSDNMLVFQADTSIPYLPGKSKEVTQYFPSTQNGWDTRSLPVGCYTIFMIARQPTDGDRMNDTARATFSITSHKLAYDLAVDTGSGPKSALPFPLNSQIPMVMSYTNIGTVEVNNVKVYATVEAPNGTVVYRDSSIIANWPVGQSISRTFKPFTSAIDARFTLTTYTTLASDQDHFDDTLHRDIRVADVSNFSVVKVVMPKDGDTVIAGTSFSPVARYRWVGNLITLPMATARMGIHNLDRPFDLVLETPLVGLGSSKQEADITFPQTDGNKQIIELPKGRYQATAGIKDSPTPAATIDFTIAHTHDVAIDSIIGPLAESYPEMPIPVGFRLKNIGRSNESNIQLDVTISNVHDTIIYHQTVTVSLDRDSAKVITLPDLGSSTKGMHHLNAMAILATDGDPEDNLVNYLFHYGPNLQDIALTAPVSPMPNEVIEQGTEFDLNVVAEWFGWELFGNNSEAHVSIVDCNSGEEMFGASATVNVPKKEVITLPSSYLGSSVKDLTAGCYNAIFTIVHVNDLDISDNRLEVPFEIRAKSGVNEAAHSHLMVMHQTAGHLELSLSEPVTGTWYIRDAIGRLIASGAVNNTDHLRVPSSMLITGAYSIVVLNDRSMQVCGQSFNYVR